MSLDSPVDFFTKLNTPYSRQRALSFARSFAKKGNAYAMVTSLVEAEDFFKRSRNPIPLHILSPILDVYCGIGIDREMETIQLAGIPEDEIPERKAYLLSICTPSSWRELLEEKAKAALSPFLPLEESLFEIK